MSELPPPIISTQDTNLAPPTWATGEFVAPNAAKELLLNPGEAYTLAPSESIACRLSGEGIRRITVEHPDGSSTPYAAWVASINFPNLPTVLVGNVFAVPSDNGKEHFILTLTDWSNNKIVHEINPSAAALQGIGRHYPGQENLPNGADKLCAVGINDKNQFVLQRLDPAISTNISRTAN